MLVCSKLPFRLHNSVCASSSYYKHINTSLTRDIAHLQEPSGILCDLLPYPPALAVRATRDFSKLCHSFYPHLPEFVSSMHNVRAVRSFIPSKSSSTMLKLPLVGMAKLTYRSGARWLHRIRWSSKLLLSDIFLYILIPDPWTVNQVHYSWPCALSFVSSYGQVSSCG